MFNVENDGLFKIQPMRNNRSIGCGYLEHRKVGWTKPCGIWLKLSSTLLESNNRLGSRERELINSFWRGIWHCIWLGQEQKGNTQLVGRFYEMLNWGTRNRHLQMHKNVRMLLVTMVKKIRGDTILFGWARRYKDRSWYWFIVTCWESDNFVCMLSNQITLHTGPIKSLTSTAEYVILA